jgi:hypothetical protein
MSDAPRGGMVRPIARILAQDTCRRWRLIDRVCQANHLAVIPKWKLTACKLEGLGTQRFLP